MIVTVLVAAVLIAAPAEADANENYRQVVVKALGFLDGDGAELEKDASCINCHHAPLRSWALREAAGAGLPVDTKELQETTGTQLKRLLKLKDSYRGQQWGHSLSTLYVLGTAEEEPLALEKEIAGSLLEIIVAEQSSSGSWKAAQQFGNQRRPKKDANEAQTLWSMLALARLEPQDAALAARERAAKWLASEEPGTTIDVRALRLVVERRWGLPERGDELLAGLIESQHADGGWGWQPDDASDAWATGLALYALSLAGDRAPAAARESARASWPEPSRRMAPGWWKGSSPRTPTWPATSAPSGPSSASAVQCRSRRCRELQRHLRPARLAGATQEPPRRHEQPA